MINLRIQTERLELLAGNLEFSEAEIYDREKFAHLMGYSILESYQNQGYASEAVRALVSWAFGHRGLKRVTAETLPDLKASIRVLEKNEFKYVGPGSEPGVIRYELHRSA